MVVAHQGRFLGPRCTYWLPQPNLLLCQLNLDAVFRIGHQRHQSMSDLCWQCQHGLPYQNTTSRVYITSWHTPCKHRSITYITGPIFFSFSIPRQVGQNRHTKLTEKRIVDEAPRDTPFLFGEVVSVQIWPSRHSSTLFRTWPTRGPQDVRCPTAYWPKTNESARNYSCDNSASRVTLEPR